MCVKLEVCYRNISGVIKINVTYVKDKYGSKCKIFMGMTQNSVGIWVYNLKFLTKISQKLRE